MFLNQPFVNFICLNISVLHISADREVQRILLELLNQMDGFDQTVNVKVCTLIFYELYCCAQAKCTNSHFGNC